MVALLALQFRPAEAGWQVLVRGEPYFKVGLILDGEEGKRFWASSFPGGMRISLVFEWHGVLATLDIEEALGETGAL